MRETATTGTNVVTRTFTTDEAGAIVKMTEAETGDATDETYLVAWNGHGDALGLAEINADGSLTPALRVTYATWGTPSVTPETGYTNLKFRYLYVGRFDVQWDDFAGAGLLYMHARHYSPEFGRFLTPDPARAGMNLYGYADNSPVTKVDPSGEIAWFAVAFLALRIASAVVAASPAIQRVAVAAPTVGNQIVRLTHIFFRHTVGWAPKDASRFLPTVRWENLIQWGVRTAFEKVTPHTKGGWTVVNTVRFNQPIGLEAIKTATGAYRYVPTEYVSYVWRNGYLWTMYPGRPRYP